MNNPYLSIVATSRNDDHGGHLLERMQAFVDGIINQSLRHQVPCELILVEWNPPNDRPSLEKALCFNKDLSFCSIRIIQVPNEVHDRFKNSQSIPLFQMLGKNVGIRRARGQFVLATNIDIIFSDSFFLQLRKKKLEIGTLYRTNRFDIPDRLPQVANYTELLTFCKKNAFRIHKARHSYVLVNNRWAPYPCTEKKESVFSSLFILFKSKSKKMISSDVKHFFFPIIILVKSAEKILAFAAQFLNKIDSFLKRCIDYALNPEKGLHTNGCGDFTLLAKSDWDALRGYAEWTIFSWHLDSLFLYQAAFSKIKHKNWDMKSPIYHIEHEKGSGYTLEDADALFKKLQKNEIDYIDNEKFQELTDLMRIQYRKQETILMNDENWGLSEIDLREVIFATNH